MKIANVIYLDDNRFVQELSIKSKNSRFKIVVSIELKISDSINFESEIFNSIKTTNFVMKLHLFEKNLIIIFLFSI